MIALVHLLTLSWTSGSILGSFYIVGPLVRVGHDRHGVALLDQSVRRPGLVGLPGDWCGGLGGGSRLARSSAREAAVAGSAARRARLPRHPSGRGPGDRDRLQSLARLSRTSAARRHVRSRASGGCWLGDNDGRRTVVPADSHDAAGGDACRSNVDRRWTGQLRPAHSRHAEAPFAIVGIQGRLVPLYEWYREFGTGGARPRHAANALASSRYAGAILLAWSMGVPVFALGLAAQRPHAIRI